jgi:hypothetical protein
VEGSYQHHDCCAKLSRCSMSTRPVPARPTRPVFSSSIVVAFARVVGLFWARVGQPIKTGDIIDGGFLTT